MKGRLVDPSECCSASLDLGAKFTGITVWNRGTGPHPFLITSTHEVRATKPIAMYSLVESFIRHHIKSPVFLIIEDYGYGGGFFSTDQAEMIGMLKHLIWNNPRFIGMSLIPPNTIKLQVTGKGVASKGEVKREILKRFPSLDRTMTSHEADSVAIGLAYQNLWETPTESMIRRCILN